ncbi:mannose-1-phosphate guanylyltransferase [Brevibacterium sanguinis]|uniref:Mannose-1-phosphate guanylyltransferase n=2 Tax=Brevibacterium TaxID=1696 RepID=A0A366IN58_9MICO|nr:MULTISPECIES: mannose-1-phosphate guanylyltransferase [Brevibacterium]RBP68075.1 mannose-1-phosphate guanylyltransferase [Brevibacterium sanguinis]RBP74508.1 mannose-1-phosphate guanylyltransferase [Brevibacterium celere]
MNSHFHAIIPAGGSGTRLWPLSRKATPKFLHDVLGTGRSLLQSTWDRVAPIVGDDRVWVVTGESHRDQVAEQLPGLSAEKILAEPSPKDSAAAIGLATMLIAREDPEAIVGSFSADHSITNVDEFRAVIDQACAAAATGDIVTVGIMPSHPATAYGYIETGALLGLPGAPSARRARAFAEKPEASTARRYVDSGRYRWNAGMFIAQATALLEILEHEDPTLHSGLSAIAEAWGTARQQTVLAEVWPGLEKRAIDYVVAEPAAAAGRVIVIPGDFGWDDVGDFDSVARLRQPVPGEPRGVISIGGSCDIVEVDASGVVFSEQPRTVAIVGLEDLVVVDTEDVLLITSRSHAQDVKKAVSAAGERGLEDLL